MRKSEIAVVPKGSLQLRALNTPPVVFDLLVDDEPKKDES